MPQWEGAYGGSGGGQFRLVVIGELIAQEEENNRSLVRYHAYMTRISSNGYRYYNGYTTYGNTNFNHENPQRAIGGFDFNMGVGARYYLASNWDKWIGHDGNGNATIYMGANHDAANSPYLTSAGAGGNWGLPSLYRYADPTLFQVTEATDVSMTLRIATNRVVDNIAISLDGGPWTYFAGSTTDRYCTIGSASAPLQSGKTYSVRISLRRQNSGFWKEHGNWDVATAVSNKFFEIGDF